MSQTTGRTETLRTSRNAIKIINQAVRRGIDGESFLDHDRWSAV